MGSEDKKDGRKTQKGTQEQMEAGGWGNMKTNVGTGKKQKE